MSGKLLLSFVCITLLMIAGFIAFAQNNGPYHALTLTYTDSAYKLNALDQPILTFEEKVGVRSDGSISLARPVLGKEAVLQPNLPPHLRIYDLSKGQYVAVDTFTESTTTYPAITMKLAIGSLVNTTCSGTAGNAMLGYSTVLAEETRSFPTGTFTTKTWMAPALNCASLRLEKTVKHPTGKGTLEIRVASAVALGDPPAWMFSVPLNYTERTPSGVTIEAVRKKGGTGIPGPTSAQDSVYASGQKLLTR